MRGFSQLLPTADLLLDSHGEPASLTLEVIKSEVVARLLLLVEELERAIGDNLHLLAVKLIVCFQKDNCWLALHLVERRQKQ